MVDSLLGGGYDCDDVGGEYDDNYDDDDEDVASNHEDDDAAADDCDDDDADDNDYASGRVNNGDDDISMSCLEVAAVDEADHHMVISAASAGECRDNGDMCGGVGGTDDANMTAVG